MRDNMPRVDVSDELMRSPVFVAEKTWLHIELKMNFLSLNIAVID